MAMHNVAIISDHSAVKAILGAQNLLEYMQGGGVTFMAVASNTELSASFSIRICMLTVFLDSQSCLFLLMKIPILKFR